ncbi:MAG: 23S rRNA (uracil(1939)-C(5))-methyltransferase RlmD [Bacillota bacterium]|nr:23S rRNA (uracil(1939)-C(5))-methyltransferase RlmD [Bacillota bacterium]
MVNSNKEKKAGTYDTTCVHSDRCGGCAYQGIPYEQQLAKKSDEVRELLQSREIEYGKLLPIEPAPTRFEYRNKMEYTFGDMEKDGPTTLGMHRKGHFMSIVTVDECQLVHPDFNIILRATLDFVKERGYSHYHKRRHRGLMRHLIIRRGVRTGEILVNICTSSEGEGAKAELRGFDEEAYAAMIVSLEAEGRLQNRIVGVLHTVNDRLADAVYCDELRVLYGRDYYNEEIMGLKFQVSAFSFFQTNVDAAEMLYSYAINLIDDFEGKKVFDLFCGTGTITQVLARKASEAVGVEIVEEAVKMAEETAGKNGLVNCRFIAGDCFKVLDSIADKPEVIVVDPPRVGISNDALDKIIGYGVDQIVYISCNPKSMVNNLYYMQYYGYKAESVKPFDNFPGTKHVETVCLLSNTQRKKKESYITLDVEMEDYYRIKNEGKDSNTGK